LNTQNLKRFHDERRDKLAHPPIATNICEKRAEVLLRQAERG
jgi:hypothetical protein